MLCGCHFIADLEDADAIRSGALRILLAQLKLDLDQLAMRINEADAVIRKSVKENDACRWLVVVRDIGLEASS